jgi:hypothetical protein
VRRPSFLSSLHSLVVSTLFPVLDGATQPATSESPSPGPPSEGTAPGDPLVNEAPNEHLRVHSPQQHTGFSVDTGCQTDLHIFSDDATDPDVALFDISHGGDEVLGDVAQLDDDDSGSDGYEADLRRAVSIQEDRLVSLRAINASISAANVELWQQLYYMLCNLSAQLDSARNLRSMLDTITLLDDVLNHLASDDNVQTPFTHPPRTRHGVPSEVLQRVSTVEVLCHPPTTYTQCAICVEDFVVGDPVRNLPCTHLFHLSCVDRWLTMDTHCPLCKVDLCA